MNGNTSAHPFGASSLYLDPLLSYEVPQHHSSTLLPGNLPALPGTFSTSLAQQPLSTSTTGAGPPRATLRDTLEQLYQTRNELLVQRDAIAGKITTLTLDEAIGRQYLQNLSLEREVMRSQEAQQLAGQTQEAQQGA